jgi:hypothetical protein
VLQLASILPEAQPWPNQEQDSGAPHQARESLGGLQQDEAALSQSAMEQAQVQPLDLQRLPHAHAAHDRQQRRALESASEQ